MVYVDNFYIIETKAKHGMSKMSHMIADTTEELMVMADNIGLSREHIQNVGTWKEHFDVNMSKRDLAIHYGAKEISFRETPKILKNKFI